MKRDMDLIRRILLQVEEKSGHPDAWVDLKIPGYSDEVVSHHVWLLQQAGLITAHDLTTGAGFDVKPKVLTWQGHEFLDLARDDTLWNRAKNQAKEKLSSISLEVLKALLTKLAMATFGGPPQ